VLIVAIGSYIEHLMKRVYEEAERHPWAEAVERATARTGQGVFLACLTTAVGFASLVTFRIFSIQEFGILAAVAVAIGGALSLTLLPAAMLVSARSAPRERFLARRWYAALVGRVTDAAVAAAGPRRWHARALLLAACVIGVYGLAVLRVGSNPPEFFPRGPPFRTSFESLLARFGADGFLFVGVLAPEGGSVLEPDFLQRVAAFQADAQRVPGVAWASSLVDRVIVRSHRVMNGDDPAFERVPDSADLAAAYVEVFRWDAPETLAEMAEDVDRPSHLVIDVFADVNDSARIAEIAASLRALIAEHFPTPAHGRAIMGGEWVLWIAQTHYIVVGKIWNIVTSVPLVGLVCLWQLRSLRAAVLSVVPAAVSAVIVIGLMGLVGIRLDLASCVITSIVVGIGADFAIHYVLRHREVLAAAPAGVSPERASEEAVRLSTPPIFNDALSNIAAFSACIASPLVPVRDFGWLICLSMASCAVAAITFLPGFLRADTRTSAGLADQGLDAQRAA
jgi:predicted RND superfamily exporter protein